MIKKAFEDFKQLHFFKDKKRQNNFCLSNRHSTAGRWWWWWWFGIPARFTSGVFLCGGHASHM
jgi:hypothetical protein